MVIDTTHRASATGAVAPTNAQTFSRPSGDGQLYDFAQMEFAVGRYVQEIIPEYKSVQMTSAYLIKILELI